MADESAWITNNSKEAAALNALGFPITKLEVVQQVVDDNFHGSSTVEISIGAVNVYHPGMALKDVINPWKRGTLSDNNPMHPFLLGLRACNAYDRMQQWIHSGARFRLRLCEGDRYTIHTPGEEPASLRALPVAETDDLRLVCALSGIGFPALNLHGQGRYRIFQLPQFGHAIRDVDGNWHQPDVRLFTARQDGKRDLALELTEPLHPIHAAYNAGHVHAQLLTEIKSRQRRRTLAVSPVEYTGKFGIISEFATDKVLDNLQAHFNLPTA